MELKPFLVNIPLEFLWKHSAKYLLNSKLVKLSICIFTMLTVFSGKFLESPSWKVLLNFQHCNFQGIAGNCVLSRNKWSEHHSFFLFFFLDSDTGNWHLNIIVTDGKGNGNSFKPAAFWKVCGILRDSWNISTKYSLYIFAKHTQRFSL